LTLDRPNILMIQADQLAPHALPAYGHPIVQAPHIDALAEDGVVFESAYCNNPLCAPSRFSMMSGQHTSRIGAFDNAAEFPGDIPTFAHYLRAGGYRTALSGKMHFVGADQLHGFEERLTTDIYPADHGWTPDWRDPDRRFDWWYHNMDSVTNAAPCERTNQIDFDDETGFQAVRHLYDMARDEDDRPFLFVVSFTDPHDPYACPGEHWDRYDHDAIDLPEVGYIPDDRCDPHSMRLRKAYGNHMRAVANAQIRNARHAYYGQISYIDDKIGRLLKALDDTGMRDNTLIVFTADHGDMLGERGLWYKMSLFERSVRVPLIISGPSITAGRAAAPVSLVDLLPTFLELSGNERLADPADAMDGESLVPFLRGKSGSAIRPVISEFLGEGAIAPCFMIRQGQYKYIYSQPDPPQLFDLENDPGELENLSGRPELKNIESALHQKMLDHQDPERLHQKVLDSQKRRRLVFQAHMTGRRAPWDFTPRRDASNQYMRNHLDLNDVEGRARIPSKTD
jgi:choline-sulfatase